MQINRSALFIVVIASLLVNGILAFLLFQNTRIIKAEDDKTQQSARVLYFRNLFDEKVLLAEQEIDFNNRLVLETTVRGLNEPEILSQWEKFTNSSNEQDARVEAKKLIVLLIKKSTP